MITNLLIVTLSAAASFTVATSVAIASDSDSIQGIYRVPVAQELAPFAEFPSRAKIQGLPSRPDRLKYNLPELLVGRRIEVTVERQADGSYEGSDAKAICSPIGAKQSCSLSYTNLQIDLVQVQNLINARIADPVEAALRFEVAKAFSTEPIGVFEYTYAISEADTRPSPVVY